MAPNGRVVTMQRNRLAAGTGYLFILTIVCVFLGIAHAARAPQWSVIDLGGLSNHGSTAIAINDRGDVVGHSAVPAPGGGLMIHTFLWQGGALQDLVAPPGPFAYSTPRAVNRHGVILVQDIQGNAFTWKDGAWTDLGLTFPSDLNKHGAVTGNYYAPNFALRAYVSSNGVFRDLGSLGGFNIFPAAMNDKGMVVGGAAVPGGEFAEHAFVYDDGVLTDLGTFGGRSSYAVDVNNHGVVAGYAQDASGAFKAFIWDAKRGMRRLSDAPGSQFVAAINDRGQVVLTVGGQAALWEDGVLTTLDALPEVRAAGFTNLVPQDINNRGTIVGWGFHASGGPASSFVLMPR